MLALTVLPSHVSAASLGWTDPTGDAHYRSEQTGPIPGLSEPAWDVTAASVQSTPKLVKWETRVLDMSAPQPVMVHGRTFAYGFRYKTAVFQLGVYETSDDPITWFSGRPVGPDGRDIGGPTEALPCPDCRVWFDARRNSVAFSVSVDTLARGIRRVIPNEPIGAGSLLEDIWVGAGPIYENPGGVGKLMLLHDIAPAPEPASLRL